MKITGALVVGAHHGDEIPEYRKHGIRNLILIEPCAPAFEVLTGKYWKDPDIQLLNFACGSYTGEASMYTETSNKGQSNSLLKPANHMKMYPDIKFRGTELVQVRPLDALPLQGPFNFMSLDVQCFEMQVLVGGKRVLEQIDYLMSEVNAPDANLYEGCTDINEMDGFLSAFGFKRPEDPKWINGAWSDAVWIKQHLL